MHGGLRGCQPLRDRCGSDPTRGGAQFGHHVGGRRDQTDGPRCTRAHAGSPARCLQAGHWPASRARQTPSAEQPIPSRFRASCKSMGARVGIWGNLHAHSVWGSPSQEERWPSGLRRTLGKRVYSKRVSGVRIPVSPQQTRPPRRVLLFRLAYLQVMLRRNSSRAPPSWGPLP